VAAHAITNVTVKNRRGFKETPCTSFNPSTSTGQPDTIAHPLSIQPEPNRIEDETGMAPETLSKEDEMKQYLLNVLQPTGGQRPAPEVLQKIMRNVHAVREEMKSAGAWVFSGGLHEPSTATVLRPQNTDVLTIDGPFAEGKEYIAGLSIIKASDLDDALRWGRKLATATTLPIEVRPFYEDGGH